MSSSGNRLAQDTNPKAVRFGEDLASLSESEQKRRADASVEAFYTSAASDSLGFGESWFESEADASVEAFYTSAETDCLGVGESWFGDAVESVDCGSGLFEVAASDSLGFGESWFGRAESACQIGGDGSPANEHELFPWAGDKRAAGKTRIFQYVSSKPGGVRFAGMVCDLFGQDSVEAQDKDYRMALRTVKQQSVFETAKRDGDIHVQPTIEAFNLSPQYANDKTRGQRQGGLSNGTESGTTGGVSPETDCPRSEAVDCRDVETAAASVWQAQYPKDRAQSIVDKRLVLDGSDGAHDYRAELLRELGTERVVQSDKFKILRKVRGQGDDYLLVPYSTRFNTGSRAASIRDGFETALETAADRYADAVVMTLTTDPNRHSGLSDAIEGLAEAKGRLMSWLATDSQLGYRPDNLTALEFTESGLPHVHVVLFGQSWAVHQSALSAKWDSLGQGRVVDIRTARSRGDRWTLHDDDSGATVALREYLGKAIRGLSELAGMDPDAVREAAEHDDVRLWRQALYWATGKQYYSCSPSLKSTGDDSGLPFVRRYEFVGVAQYQDIPAHVRHNARVYTDRGRPPPRSGGQSTVS